MKRVLAGLIVSLLAVGGGAAWGYADRPATEFAPHTAGR